MLNRMSQEDLNNLLCYAVLEGTLEEIHGLLKKGSEVECSDHYPLRRAAYDGRKQVCRLLLRHGASWEKVISSDWITEKVRDAVKKMKEEIETEMIMENL